MRKTRLFTKTPKLEQGLQIKIQDNDFEYLTKVLRKKIADEIFMFNGFDGEFRASIGAIEKKSLILNLLEKTADLPQSSNITLAFALIKRVDFIAEKATELGVSSFQPIITKHTIIDRINVERFAANVKEACEQCERNDFPKISELKKLDKFLLEEANAEKILILCDESGLGQKASELLPKINRQNKEIVILIGPEGGFSAEEFAKMRDLKNLYSLSLGPRILRADTAAISALTLVQEFL